MMKSFAFKLELQDAFQKLIRLAVSEDIKTGDITTEALGQPTKAWGQGEIIVKEEKIVVCGLSVTDILFGKKFKFKKNFQSKNSPRICYHFKDGEEAVRNQKILTITAPIGELLCKERILLNFLQHLSGTATQTKRWVTALYKTLGDEVALLDTRKTLPGYRILEKYAVFCGGGKNHRIGLFDHYLVKDNHIEIARGPLSALKKVIAHRSRSPQMSKAWIEVECANLKEVSSVLEFNRQSSIPVDIIMLDNFSLSGTRKALDIINKSCRVEVSGNISLAKIKKFAPLKGKGIDYISAGVLTHSVPAVDLSMRINYV